MLESGLQDLGVCKTPFGIPAKNGKTLPVGCALALFGRNMAVLRPKPAMFEEKNGTIQRVSDHGLSLGIYIKDPDGNGIEVYGETPRKEWLRPDNLFMSGDRPQGNFPGPWEAGLAPDGVTAAR